MVDVFQGLEQALPDFVDAFHPALRDGHQAKDYLGGIEVLKQTQIVVTVGILHGYGVDTGGFHGIRDFKVGTRIRLGIVGMIQPVRVTAAHVHGPLDMVGTAVKCPFQILKPVVQGRGRFAGEQRLIDLDVAAAGFGKRQHFPVQGIRDIRSQPCRIMVVGIRVGVAHCHRTRHGELDRAVGAGLGPLPVARGEQALHGHRPVDGGEIGGIGSPAHFPVGQIDEVKAVQVAAVVMDVVFPDHLAVRGNIDPGFHLLLHGLLDTAGDDGFRIRAHVLHGPFPELGRIRRVRTGGDVEPVGQFDIVGFRPGADTGRLDGHGTKLARDSFIAEYKSVIQAPYPHEGGLWPGTPESTNLIAVNSRQFGPAPAVRHPYHPVTRETR